MIDLAALASHLGLGALLEAVRRTHGDYELVAHWQQGEFHHDLVLRIDGAIVVVATNCNGGVKEVLAFADVPDRYAMWSARCPENDELKSLAQATLPPLLGEARTVHWFDPCVLLADDARSELKAGCRTRMPGGGFTSS